MIGFRIRADIVIQADIKEALRRLGEHILNMANSIESDIQDGVGQVTIEPASNQREPTEE
jgi:hypothetical protein